MYTKSLLDLVVTVFETIGFVTHHPMQILTHPLADSRLSYILTRINSKSEYIGVIVCDWKRIVGIGQICKTEELLHTCPELNQVLIVSAMGFSRAAKHLVEKRKKISLISKRELISLMLKQLEIS
ncbi:MAG: restriction endonuclease [Candidatus Heimdallarchaeota archaeon]|nr:MAG: restriction endonuclease [Candidatus Heimdallarchaeota archaeon]